MNALIVDAKKNNNRKSNAQWIFSLMKEEWIHLSVGIAGMGVSSAMNLVFPKIMGKAIDVAVGKPPPAELTKKGFMIVVLSTFITGSLASFLRVYSLGMVAEKVAAKLRRKLYTSLLAQELSFFHQRKVGELTTRLSGDCQVTADAVVDIMANGFRSLNSAIGASCMLLSISPKLTFVSLSILPVVGTGAMIFSKFSSHLSQVHQSCVTSMNAAAEEKLNNILTVKLFAAEKLEERQFDKINNNILTSASRAKIARGLFMAGISLSVNTSLFSVFYFGGSLVGSNDLTIGSLASFALYSGFMGLGFSQLSSVFGDLRRTRESSKTLFELLEDPPNLEKSPKQNKLKSVKGDIKFDCVSFCYPSRPENLVLRDFTLNVKPGEVVAIVGRSGAGKSTTAALLTKLFSPSGGTIFLDGVDLATLDTSWLRRQIGVVNQDPALFGASISENIIYGSSTQDSERLIAASKKAHVHDFVMKLPNKYDTFVGQKGYELSGGQKQRIAIARAFYKQSKILLFDEATSSLDGNSEDMIQNAFESASQDRTIIIIAHRLQTIRNAHKIVVLDEGSVREIGAFDDLYKDGTFFYELVKSKASFN